MFADGPDVLFSPNFAVSAFTVPRSDLMVSP
jgi:hypothetical protein